MIKSKIRAAIATMAIVVAPSVVSAEMEVIGQVVANPSAMVNAATMSTRIGKERVPYVQGDIVTTDANSTATVSLTSGKASFVAAPSTDMQVVNGELGEVALSAGSIQFTAAEDFPVSFTTPAGTFTVSADSAIDAVAVVEADKFVVASKAGSISVNSQSGVVSEVGAGEAFAFDGQAQVVDVQLLSGGFLGLTGGAAWAAAFAAFIGTVVVVDEVINDDDDASPN